MLQPVLQWAGDDQFVCSCYTFSPSSVEFFKKLGFDLANLGSMEKCPYWILKKMPENQRSSSGSVVLRTTSKKSLPQPQPQIQSQSVSQLPQQQNISQSRSNQNIIDLNESSSSLQIPSFDPFGIFSSKPNSITLDQLSLEDQEKLFQKFSSSSTNNNNNEKSEEEEGLCSICLENPSNSVLLECSHQCACYECAKKLKDCPICRGRIVRIIKVFKS